MKHAPSHNYTPKLGICMCIGCLTWSTWKVYNGEALEVLVRWTPCCPPPIRSWVSKQSKSLGWWRSSRLLSPLSCRLSSFCWTVNHLPYIWTCSGIIYPPSPWTWSCHVPSHDSIMSGMCQKIRKLCINPYISIVNKLRNAYVRTSTTSDQDHSSAHQPHGKAFGDNGVSQWGLNMLPTFQLGGVS